MLDRSLIASAMSSDKIKIAIPVGDPAGIGPEIALKAALDPAVRAVCDPIIVCDRDLLARHARAGGLDASIVRVLPCPQPDTASLPFGIVSPIAASTVICPHIFAQTRRQQDALRPMLTEQSATSRSLCGSPLAHGFA